MRLFIVERIRLHDLAGMADGPGSGDVVAYWRHAQDVDGSATEAFRRVDVTVDWAESRVDKTAATGIDEFVDQFGRNWHLLEGVDVTAANGFSYGECCTRDLFGKARINLLVRYGYVFEQLFDAYPGVESVYTDLEDNENWLRGEGPDPNPVLRRQFLDHRADVHGIPCHSVTVEDPIPFYAYHGRDPGFFPLIRSYIGGFRARYLLGRLRLRATRKQRPRIYVFISAGLDRVAEALGERGDVEVVSDLKAHRTVTPLRFDHLLAIPSWEDLRAARRLLQRVKEIQRRGFGATPTRFGTIDFATYFLAMIRQLVGRSTLPLVIATAQMNRMFKLGRFDLVVINGEGSHAVRAAAGLAGKHGYQVAHIDHSNTLVPFGYHPYGRNSRHVIYISQGEDHVESYGRKLPAESKPWRPVVTSPALAVMDRIRDRRANPPGRRVLLTNYSPALGYSIARTSFRDKYFIDLCDAARLLLDDGYAFTYRPHPGFNNPAYVDYLLNETGMAEHIRLDTVKDFGDSLMNHDVIVVNVSGCFYQALYAGWPTIFYQPEFDPDHYVGLPAATDIEQPIAATPEELSRLIRDGVERDDSLVARFPELFTTKYAHRFIGRDADRAAEALSAFLAEDILDQRAHPPAVP